VSQHNSTSHGKRQTNHRRNIKRIKREDYTVKKGFMMNDAKERREMNDAKEGREG